MSVKARPLSDPRVKGRPNLGVISIINFFGDIWAISVQVGKVLTQPETVSAKTSQYLYP